MLARAGQVRPNRLPQTTTSRSTGATSISPILKLIALTIFLPSELSFYISDFRLSPIRLVLFSLTPVLVIHFGRLLQCGKRHILLPDVLVALTGVWMIVSPALVFDLDYSLHHSAPFVFEFCGSYLAGRTLLSERGQALSFVNLMCHVIAIVALVGALDSLFSWAVTHEFVIQLTGSNPQVNLLPDYRLGIARAMGPIDHPILFGTVCAIGLLFAVGLPIRAKSLTIATCGVGVVLSLSSAPVEGAILGLGLLAYDSIFGRFRSRWWVLVGVGVLGMGILYALTNSPMNFLFGHLNFDAQTYWIRLNQWDIIGSVVLNSPWIGVAFQWPELSQHMPVWIAASVDSLWLLLALEYGIPGAVLTGLSVLSAIPHSTSGSGANLTKQESKLVLILDISIFTIFLLGFTVDFWGASWMLIGLLIGIRAHLADLGLQRFSMLKKAKRVRQVKLGTIIDRPPLSGPAGMLV